jgi:hypothetical protein
MSDDTDIDDKETAFMIAAQILALGPPFKRDTRERIKAVMDHGELVDAVRSGLLGVLREYPSTSKLADAVVKLYEEPT